LVERIIELILYYIVRRTSVKMSGKVLTNPLLPRQPKGSN